MFTLCGFGRLHTIRAVFSKWGYSPLSKSLPLPEFGAPLPAAHPSDDAVALLWRRRSTPADFLAPPGPDAQTLEAMLTIAARAPDHRRVTPFRFVIFEGAARARFGDALAAAFVKDNPEAEQHRIDCERNRFTRAPVVIAVIASPNPDHKTPVWEQTLTAGAVCQNMLIAASAYGFAAQWITEWYAYHDDINRVLSLSDHEQAAGYIYIGTAKEDPKERARPALDDIVTRFA